MQRKKKMSFFPPWEFQTPLSLGTPRLLIILPKNWLSLWRSESDWETSPSLPPAVFWGQRFSLHYQPSRRHLNFHTKTFLSVPIWVSLRAPSTLWERNTMQTLSIYLKLPVIQSSPAQTPEISVVVCCPDYCVCMLSYSVVFDSLQPQGL